MSRTFELAGQYRKQTVAETERILRCVGPKMHKGADGLAYRAAYWKAVRKIQNKIYPRGKRNFVLEFEGSI